jgi:hypothetical protein
MSVAWPHEVLLWLSMINPRHTIRPAKTYINFILISLSVGFPFCALSDHVPDNLAQELNPNYVGCMMAVEDADDVFRETLQSSCIERMGDICSGGNGTNLPSQAFDCVYFEIQRAVDFMTIALPDLPTEVETSGFFGHGYQRRRASILEDIESLQNQDKPYDFEVAVQQVVTMASAVTTLFWLARKTDTPMEVHVQTANGTH